MHRRKRKRAARRQGGVETPENIETEVIEEAPEIVEEPEPAEPEAGETEVFGDIAESDDPKEEE